MSATGINVAEIPTWNLMGASIVKPANNEEVPKSTLHLTVVGILHASDPQYSQVIIASDSNAQVYSVGEEIDNGVKVYEILANSVIISRDGKLEKIELPKQLLQFAPPPSGLDLKDTSSNEHGL